MNDEKLAEQAAALEQMLPRLMRQLFTLEHEHPVNELPLAQRRVCTILQAGPRGVSCLGDELRISPSAMTQMADRLERAGLVERITGDDRRVKKLQLSERGGSMMRSRQRRRIRRTTALLEHLDPGERDAAIALVQQLVDASGRLGPDVITPADFEADAVPAQTAAQEPGSGTGQATALDTSS
ncbi:MAG: MarR family transcriptional regulator [Chloroflexi bacterium]|nr:MarR family transcriptional regulator [Chloroflexota bacterium]